MWPITQVPPRNPTTATRSTIRGGPSRLRCGASVARLADIPATSAAGCRGRLRLLRRDGRRGTPGALGLQLGGGLAAVEHGVVLTPYEGLDALTGDVIVDLERRTLHEVGRGSDERARQAPVEAELGAADGVGDDAGAVGAVPDLELELEIERHVAVGRALYPDVAPLAVLEPRHVVRRTDVDVLLGHRVVEHRGDGVRLADLLRLETLALEHVEEVRVAAEVQLVGPVDPNAAVHEQPGEDAVGDRRPDLALDVVADDRQALL